MQKKSIDKIIIEPHHPATHSVIWLHGLGADGHDFVNIIPALKIPKDQMPRFIFPHAPIRPITINGGMPMRGWFDILSLSRLEHEDKNGVVASEKIIQTLIEEEIEKNIPSNRIILAGFSQGGCMALYTGLHYSKPLAGLLILSGYLPLMSVDSHFPDSNKNISILQMHGTYDDILPFTLGQKTHDYLSSNHYSVEWKSYAMRHEVCEKQIDDMGKWLRGLLSPPRHPREGGDPTMNRL